MLQLTISVTLLVLAINGEPCKRRVCFYNNKAQYRPTPQTKFLPQDIDVSLCTHIVYSRAVLQGNKVVPNDQNDESNSSFVGNYQKVTDLRGIKPDLLVLLVVDASGCESDPFVSMASTASSRNEFIASAILFLRNHTFDGLVFRCLFLGQGSTNSQFKTLLTDIIIDLRGTLDQDSSGPKKLLLVLDVFGEKLVDVNSYNVEVLSRNVDWIHLMAVYLHGDWNNVTGHHSPLYQNYNNKGRNPHFSIELAVKYWTGNGAPKDKLVLELPAYGLTFTLTSSRTDVGAPSSQGKPGPYSILPSRLAYYEICDLLNQEGTLNNFLDTQRVPYLVAKDQWVGYDDVASLTTKVRYLIFSELGGFLFRSLDLDDFTGKFCKQGSFPLLRSLNEECSRTDAASFSRVWEMVSSKCFERMTNVSLPVVSA